MTSATGFLLRNWRISHPPDVPKDPNALKFGILGAANVAPTALIQPAKSHPEVIIQAVAARNRDKAEVYAKKHGIPQVIDSYEAMLDDPSIDAVYIPLPSSLHYEWALRAVAKGKHVLLEKPAVVNATEAASLFRSPLLLANPKGPVLLEAIHFRFQPTWQYFLSLVDRPNLQIVTATTTLPSYMIPRDGMRFDYELGGGNMLDLGTYAMYALRQVTAAEPEECTSCTVRTPPPPRELCDEAAEAAFRFPGDVVGEAIMDLRASPLSLPTFKVTVLHREVPVVDDDEDEDDEYNLSRGTRKFRIRKLTLNNFLVAAVTHCIDIEDEFVIRKTNEEEGEEGEEERAGVVVQRWTKKESKKVFTFKDAGIEQPSEPCWTSYRHQLEQFVHRIRGRQGSGLWVGLEDSLAQARMIDMAYAQSGLPLRRTSTFALS